MTEAWGYFALGLLLLALGGDSIVKGASGLAQRIGASPFVAGLLLMSLSMLPIGMVSSLQQLFMLICTFYIGSIIAEPARETLSAELADPRARGSYMGFSRLGLAIGGALGYAGGGWLFDAGKAFNQPELPWVMLTLIGVTTFFALGWQFSHKRAAPGVLEPGA